MNKDARLQLRIDSILLEKVKKLAKQNGVSLSRIVEQYLRSMVEESKPTTTDEHGVRQV